MRKPDETSSDYILFIQNVQVSITELLIFRSKKFIQNNFTISNFPEKSFLVTILIQVKNYIF